MADYFFNSIVGSGLRSKSGKNPGETAVVHGYYEMGDGGGGVFYWDAQESSVEDNGGTIIVPILQNSGVWRRITTGAINVQWFGARSKNTNTISVSNQVGNQLPEPVKSQTECGDAIQRAIDFAHSQGGGQVFIPNGLWWIYSYIVIKPNVELVGSGSGTILKSVDEAPNENGYGMLQCGPYLDKALPQHSRLYMSVRDMVLDGNTYKRGNPADGAKIVDGAKISQFQTYNLAIYDSAYYNEPEFQYSTDVRISNVTSLNSPIDCFAIHLYYTTERDRISVTDCFFSDAYRNTVTVASATHVQFSNCDFKNGGVPHGGHSPKACLDLEPNDNRPINKKILFIGCRFANGVTYLVVSTNSNAQFANCTFTTGMNTENKFPFDTRISDIRFTSSTFEGIDGSHGRDYYFRQTSNSAKGIMPFDNPASNRLELNDCEFEGIGLEIQGHQAFVTNCSFLNSKMHVLFFPPHGVMKGCILQNMGWYQVKGDPAPGKWKINGSLSTQNESKTKNIIFSDILVRVNKLILPAEFTPPERQYGVHFDLDKYTIHLSNIRVEGYYSLDAISGDNPNDFRDWGQPNLPPTDSPSPSPDSVDRGTVIRRGCTHGGKSFIQEEVRPSPPIEPE